MSQDQSKLKRLESALYSRNGFIPDDPITPLQQQESVAPTAWNQKTMIPDLPVRQHTPLVKVIVWFSVIFFTIAVAVAGWLFYTGYNTVSTGNVDIVLAGPTSIAGGAPLSLGVTIQNRNAVDLQNAYLVVEYPEGARKTFDAIEPLLRDRIPVGTLASGAATSKNIQAVFFGVKDTQEKISMSLQYGVAESSGVFEKDTEYYFTLGPAPVDVTLSYPKEVSSGQTVTLDVDVISNTTIPLSNIILKLEYPSGFTFTTALPAPDTDTNVWNIATLLPGQKQHMTIIGKLEGPENEVRAFRYTVGNPDPANRRIVATPFLSDAKQTLLTKAFIGLDLALGGSTEQTVFVSGGSTVSANLTVLNNLVDRITDAIIQVEVTGAYLDKSTIQPGQGFYQSATNIISWDSRQISALRSLDPEDEAHIQFTFGTIPFSKLRTAQVNQPITVTITAKGVRNTSTVAQPVSSTIVRQIKFLSQADFEGTVVHSVGPFSNTGAIPPKAEKETTYTVIWSIRNTYNPLTNGKITATLPPYVRFLNTTSPATENVTYDPNSGIVTWNVGNIAANTGYGSSPKQVAFQVAISPSKTQIGSAPELVGTANFTAEDTVTSQSIDKDDVALTIQMPTDPSYKPAQGTVVQ